MLTIGDCREWARGLAPGSVQTIVTSPPYFGLRSYLPTDHPDKARELGGEQTPDEFVANLVALFRDLRAALHPTGTLWLNLGDSYASGPGGGVGASSVFRNPHAGGGASPAKVQNGLGGRAPIPEGLKPKDLIGIPWLTAFALRADGWYLRSAITWCKRAPMPESVTDRPTSATEMVFLLTKSPRYYYDAAAIQEPAAASVIARAERGYAVGGRNRDASRNDGDIGRRESFADYAAGRNARNFWLLGPEPFPAAHFATFPSEIPRRAIRAGTSEKGACAACGAPWRRVVERPTPPADLRNRGNGAKMDFHTRQTGSGQKLQDWYDANPAQTVGWKPSCGCNTIETRPCLVADPFAGSGTTLAVAEEENRAWVGCDLDSRAAGWLAGRLARVQRRLPLAM
jgi:DNA modification methylase